MADPVDDRDGSRGDGNGRTADDARLLHVEDDPAFAELAGEYLSRVAPEIDRVTVRSVEAASERYRNGDFDAVVCDYDLPDGTGIDFLRAVREHDEDLPFVLFTGKGSEEVASEAISAGVTDYLQKEGGGDQFEVLANRIRNAVERYRLTRQVERGVAALDTASEPIGIIDGDGRYVYVNAAYASVYGVDPDELVGTHWGRLYPAEEIERFECDVLPELTHHGHWSGTATGVREDGTPVEERLALTHTSDGGHVCVIREAEARTNDDSAASPRDGPGADADAERDGEPGGDADAERDDEPRGGRGD